MTKIEWTEATWNPIVGCSIVSPGCTNCYAMKMAARLEAIARGDEKAAIQARERLGQGRLTHYLGTTKPAKTGPVWTGHLAMAPDRTLTEPLRRCKPTTYFVNSMGDLFHEDCPDDWIDRVFAVMALSSQHTFQVLTKRAARMRAYCSDKRRRAALIAHCPHGWTLTYDNKLLFDWPLPNVWLGVSAERQAEADARIPDLLATPAAVRFVSAEPLLGPIDFARLDVPDYGYLNALTEGWFADGRQPRRRLDWIIVGGESGPGARPMHPDWARSIRDQCTAASVPFFFKQWGEWEVASDENGRRNGYSGHVMPSDDPKFRWVGMDGRTAAPSASALVSPSYAMARVGKARAGRHLDGREWNETPAQRQPAEVA